MSNLGLKEIVSCAVRTIKSNFVKIIVLLVMICLPLEILMQVIDYKTGGIEEISKALETIGTYTGDMTSSALETALAGININAIQIHLICTAIVYVLMSVYYMGIIKMTYDTATADIFKVDNQAHNVDVVIENSEKSAIDYFNDGVKCLPRYIFSFLLTGILAFAGFMMCFVPGILMSLIMSFVVYDAALTKHTGIKSIRYVISIIFARPTILIYDIVTSLIVSVVYSLITWPLSIINISGVPAIIINTAATMVYDLLCAAGTIIVTIVFARNAHRNPILQAELVENDSTDNESDSADN